MRVVTDDPAKPVLVIDDQASPACLVVTFPPQTIAESAYFEWTAIARDAPSTAAPDPEQVKSPPPSVTHEPVPPPGTPRAPGLRVARLSNESRIVFDVGKDATLDFTVAGMLDWHALGLRVNAIAAIPPDPTPDQIAGAPPIQRPSQTETALELPDRMWISPNADVSWRHRQGTLTSRGRTELWHTRVVPTDAPAYEEPTPFAPTPLRAIWSPDYAPQNPPLPEAKDPELGRTAMSANDRHQLVILTSAFHGFEVDSEVIVGLNPALRVVASPRIAGHYKQPFVPTPFGADLLMLSALGGWLRSRGQWDPPDEIAPTKRVIDVLKLFALSSAQLERIGGHANLARPAVADPLPTPYKLDLSEWVHVAAGGRDHYVRIVYEGELKPFGHRAALVKVPERKFVEQDGVVGAYLFQRMFVVVREFEKTFGEDGACDAVQAGAVDDASDARHRRSVGRAEQVPLESSFLLGGRARRLDGTIGHFPFHAVGTDIGGNRVDFTVPMMFVSRSETDRPTVIDAYNSPDAVDLRDAVVPGQKSCFAPAAAAGPAGASDEHAARHARRSLRRGPDSEQPRCSWRTSGSRKSRSCSGRTPSRRFATSPTTSARDSTRRPASTRSSPSSTQRLRRRTRPIPRQASWRRRSASTSGQTGPAASQRRTSASRHSRREPARWPATVGRRRRRDIRPGDVLRRRHRRAVRHVRPRRLAVGGTVDAAAPKMQTNSTVVGGKTQIVTTFAGRRTCSRPSPSGRSSSRKARRRNSS